MAIACFIFNRGQMEKANLTNIPHVIISISEPGQEYPNVRLNALTRDCLRLQFDDLDEQPSEHAIKALGGCANIQLFTIDHAIQIAEFVKNAIQQHNVTTFLIHCAMGRCRSPAIGAALCKYYNGDDADFFRRYTPNRLVYSILLRVLMETEDTLMGKVITHDAIEKI